MYLVVEVWYFVEELVSINAILQHLCSHATVTDSDLLSLIGIYDWDLYFYLTGRSTHQNLMSCSQILNSIKGFKLKQLQWSNITWRSHRDVLTSREQVSCIYFVCGKYKPYLYSTNLYFRGY